MKLVTAQFEFVDGKRQILVTFGGDEVFVLRGKTLFRKDNPARGYGGRPIKASESHARRLIAEAEEDAASRKLP